MLLEVGTGEQRKELPGIRRTLINPTASLASSYLLHLLSLLTSIDSSSQHSALSMTTACSTVATCPCAIEKGLDCPSLPLVMFNIAVLPFHSHMKAIEGNCSWNPREGPLTVVLRCYRARLQKS